MVSEYRLEIECGSWHVYSNKKCCFHKEGIASMGDYRYHELRPLISYFPCHCVVPVDFPNTCPMKDFLSNNWSIRTRYLHFNTIFPKPTVIQLLNIWFSRKTALFISIFSITCFFAGIWGFLLTKNRKNRLCFSCDSIEYT